MATIDGENAKKIRQTMTVEMAIVLGDGTTINIDNDNLIEAIVSLRADLSRFEPTFPASELEVDAYFEEDIAEQAALIPAGTPITYSAGYAGDMSPVRNFYIDEQITWENGVLHIHAQDLTEKLERTIYPFSIGFLLSDSSAGDRDANLEYVYQAFRYVLLKAGITYATPEGIEMNTYDIDKIGFRNEAAIIEETTARDLITRLMWLFHIEFSSIYDVPDGFWPVYVDAGRPTLRWKFPSSLWTINESECGDVKRHVERPVKTITAKYLQIKYATGRTISTEAPQIGTVTLNRNVGASVDFDPLVIGDYQFIFRKNRGDTIFQPVSVRPGTYEQRVDDLEYAYIDYLAYPCGRVLMGPDIPQSERTYVSQFLEWDNSTMGGTTWTNMKNSIGFTGNEVEGQIVGKKVNTNEVSASYSINPEGEDITIEDPVWIGTMKTGLDDGTVVYVFPQLAIRSVAKKSNISGSFTWKGDPRMQPRDVFTFHRLDGSDEVCTIENITLQHQGGGTTAEITYRKGYV